MRRRDLLIVILTLTTGAIDAACFLRLGGVFSSVVTGNLVLTGVAAGRAAAALAVSASLAIGGYAAGVLAGALICGQQPVGHESGWPARVTRCLAAELVLLALLCACWLAAAGAPGHGLRLAMLGLAAVAMGMQSAGVRRLGPMSTTYLTSTVTAVVEGIAAGRRAEGFGRSLGCIAAIVAGAVAGAAAAHGPSWQLPVAVLVPAAVVVTSAACWPPGSLAQS